MWAENSGSKTSGKFSSRRCSRKEAPSWIVRVLASSDDPAPATSSSDQPPSVLNFQTSSRSAAAARQMCWLRISPDTRQRLARDWCFRRDPDRSEPYSRPWKENGHRPDRQARTPHHARRHEKSRFRGNGHRRLHPIWFFARRYPRRQANKSSFIAAAGQTLDIAQDHRTIGRTINVVPRALLGRKDKQ